jgi:hypothetical protein
MDDVRNLICENGQRALIDLRRKSPQGAVVADAQQTAVSLEPLQTVPIPICTLRD